MSRTNRYNNKYFHAENNRSRKKTRSSILQPTKEILDGFRDIKSPMVKSDIKKAYKKINNN